jgi:hypothetical protein
MHERIYHPGADDVAVLKLREKVWGAHHPHTDASFFKWLFQDNPDGCGSGVVSLQDDAIIGFAGIIQRQACLGDQSLSICHGLEFMVDPDTMRKLTNTPLRVLKAHLQRMKDLRADIAINYPNDNSVRLLTSKYVGYKKVFEPQLFARTLPNFRFSDKASLKQTAQVSVARVASVYSNFVSWHRKGDVFIEKIDKFDDRFDDLNVRINSDNKLRFNRSSRFLNWRYKQHPLYRYNTFAATRAGELAGYIVVSSRQLFNTNVGLICDLNVAGNDSKSTEYLIDAAYDHARRNNLSVLVDQQLSDNNRSHALQRCGFLKIPPRFNPKQFRMVARHFNERGSVSLDPSMWAFSWGDMDVV